MFIRQATKSDSETLATLMMIAMEDIVYELIAVRNYEKGIAFLRHFTQRENNQYSYANCYVVEVNGVVIAAANVYNGAHLNSLRMPVLKYIDNASGRELTVEDETQEGEFYIDILSVDPNSQGQGIGSALLNYLIDIIVIQNRQNLGLLVDVDNPKAKKLYLKHGFLFVGFKILLGKKLEHLQITPHYN